MTNLGQRARLAWLLPLVAAGASGCGTSVGSEPGGQGSRADAGVEVGSDAAADSGSDRGTGGDAGTCADGCTKSGSHWVARGPGGGGWFRNIKVDPRSPNVLYVTGDLPGVYKSTDYGNSWTMMDQGLVNVASNDIAIDPQNSNVLLLATNGGVHKSIDGGKTWQVKRDNAFPPPNRDWTLRGHSSVSALAISPVDPNLAFAGGGSSHYQIVSNVQAEIYRSTDLGDTWNVSSQGLIHTQDSSGNNDLAITGFCFDRTNRSQVYTTATNGFYRSTDAGQSWTRETSGLPSTILWHCAVDPSDGSTLYLTADEPQGVYRSTDGGRTWTKRAGGIDANATPEDIHFSPARPDTIYVGIRNNSVSLYESTDGGGSWAPLGRPTGASELGWIGQYWGSPITYFDIDPSDASRIYYVNSGQIYKSEDGGKMFGAIYTKNMGGDTWSGTGAEILVNNQIFFHPTIPGRMFFAEWDVGLLVSEDYGKSFRDIPEIKSEGGDVYWVAADPSSPNIVYASQGRSNKGSHLFKSSDGGETWSAMTTDLPAGHDDEVRHLVIVDSGTTTSRTMFASVEGNGIYKSTDSGASWEKVLAGARPAMVAVDPSHPDRLFAGFEDSGSLDLSEDGGGTWNQLDPDEMKDVRWILVDPNDPNIVWVAQRGYSHANSAGDSPIGGVWKSTDGGQSFTRVLSFPGIPGFVTMLAFDPRDSSVVYATNRDDGASQDMFVGQGLYVTKNGGRTWEDMNNGLPYLNLNSVALDPRDPSHLFVGTTGAGHFEYEP